MKLIEELGLNRKQVAYVGDDVIDLPAMTKVGLAIAVADARPEVKKHAAWVTEDSGGQGAVREVCELIMKAQNKFDDKIKTYLS